LNSENHIETFSLASKQHIYSRNTQLWAGGFAPGGNTLAEDLRRYPVNTSTCTAVFPALIGLTITESEY